MQGLERQTYREFEHFVVAGLPKREAHDRLYGTFMARAAEFGVFVKVDADMVIENPNLFAQIAERFRADSEIDLLTIPVCDFITDRLIDGMHAYRSSVRWPLRDSEVFTDRHPVPEHRRTYDHALAPAAIHCGNPAPFQAFHFGLHRGVKARSYLLGSGAGQGTNLQFHLDNMRLVYDHFVRDGDRRLGFAALGGYLALLGRFRPEHIAYTNTFAHSVFAGRYQKWSKGRLSRTVSFLRVSCSIYVALARLRWGECKARATTFLRRVLPAPLLRAVRAVARHKAPRNAP